MMAQMADPASPEPKPPQEPPAEGDPEAQETPAELAIPGQENLSPEEIAAERERITAKADELQITPQEVLAQEEAERAANDGEPKNVLSQVEQALEGMDDDAKGHLIELADFVKHGGSLKDLKQGHKLLQRITELERSHAEELENVRASAASAPATTGNFPKSVAALKTVQDVRDRHEQVNGYVDYITDLLDANPGGPDTVVAEEGGKQYTRQELITRRSELRTEARQLPQRAQQIQGDAQRQAAQVKATSEFRSDFPWSGDANHAETKAIRQKLKDNPFLNHMFISPEYAAAVWMRGEKAMQQELAARKKSPGARPAAKPVGKVPLGKPHAPSAGAAGRPAAAASTATSAMTRLKKEHSADALADVMQHMSG